MPSFCGVFWDRFRSTPSARHPHGYAYSPSPFPYPSPDTMLDQHATHCALTHQHSTAVSPSNTFVAIKEATLCKRGFRGVWVRLSALGRSKPEVSPPQPITTTSIPTTPPIAVGRSTVPHKPPVIHLRGVGIGEERMFGNATHVPSSSRHTQRTSPPQQPTSPGISEAYTELNDREVFMRHLRAKDVPLQTKGDRDVPRKRPTTKPARPFVDSKIQVSSSASRAGSSSRGKGGSTSTTSAIPTGPPLIISNPTIQPPRSSLALSVMRPLSLFSNYQPSKSGSIFNFEYGQSGSNDLEKQKMALSLAKTLAIGVLTNLVDILKGDSHPQTRLIISDLQHNIDGFASVIGDILDWAEDPKRHLPEMESPKHSTKRVDRQWSHKEDSLWSLLDHSITLFTQFLNEVVPEHSLLKEYSRAADRLREYKRAAAALNDELPAYGNVAKRLFLKLQHAHHTRVEVRLRDQFNRIRGESPSLHEAYKYCVKSGDRRARQVEYKYDQRKNELRQLKTKIESRREQVKSLHKQLKLEKRVEQTDMEKEWNWLLKELQSPVLELGNFDERDGY